MTTISDEFPAEPVGSTDGRAARRQRNLNAVLDAVIEMFGEDMVVPTIEQAASRSGLSLRTLYRYFPDAGALVEAVVRHHQARYSDAAHLAHIGRGPLHERIADLVSARVRLFDAVAPVFRASVINAPRLPRVAEQLADSRARLREQFERQFAPELGAIDAARRDAITDAGDLLTQLDSIDLLARHRLLAPLEIERVLRAGLTALLADRA